jgi:hypothetical protein
LETIAPDPANMRRVITFMALMSVAGLVILASSAAVSSYGTIGARGAAFGVAMVAFGGLGLGALALVIRNQRLLVGGDVLGYQDLFGRRHVWSSSQIGTVVDAMVTMTRKAAPRRYIFVLGPDGRRVMFLQEATWGPAAIDRILRAAGAPVQVRTGPISPAALREEFPGTFGWLYSHPNVFGAAIVVVVLAIVIGVSIATLAIR